MSGPPSKPPPPKPSITPTGTPTLSPQIGSPPTLLSPTTTVPKKTGIPSSSSQSSTSQSTSTLLSSTISKSSPSSGPSSGSLPWISAYSPGSGGCDICGKPTCCIKCHVCSNLDAYADKFSLHGRNAEVVGLLTKDEYARLGPLQAAVVDAVEKYEEIWKKLGPLQDSPARMDTEAGRAEQRELSQSSTANEALREKLKAEGEDIVQKLVKRFWAGVDFPIRSPLERARLVFAWVAKSFDNYPGCKEKWSSFERSNAATILWGKEVCHGYCELFLALYNHDVTSSDMQAVKVEGWDRSKPYERWAGKDLTDKSTKTTHDWIAVPLGDGTFRFMDPHWGSGRMVEKSVARSVKGTVVTEKTWEWESDFSPHWFYMDHELFLRTHWPNDPDRRYLKSGLSSSYQQWVEPRGPKYYSVLQKHLDVLTLLPDSTSIGIKDRTSIAVSFPKGCVHDKRTMTEYSIEGQKGSTAVFKPNGELWVANYKITEPVDEEFDLSFIIQPPGTKLQMVGAEWRCKRDLREQKKEVSFSSTRLIPLQITPGPTLQSTPKPALTTTPAPTSPLTSKPILGPTSPLTSKPTPGPTSPLTSGPTPAPQPTSRSTSPPPSQTTSKSRSPPPSRPAPTKTSASTLVSTTSTIQAPVPGATPSVTTAIPPTSTPTSPTGPRPGAPSKPAPPPPTQKKQDPPPPGV